MVHTVSKLTVFFEDPFWVAVYERECGGILEAAKVTFGAEPKDYEVYTFFLWRDRELSFSPPVKAGKREETRMNPKRMQRQIRRALASTGVGAKAQQALSAQRELFKAQGEEKRRERKREEKERRFVLRHEKKKEKHRGR